VPLLVIDRAPFGNRVSRFSGLVVEKRAVPNYLSEPADWLKLKLAFNSIDSFSCLFYFQSLMGSLRLFLELLLEVVRLFIQGLPHTFRRLPKLSELSHGEIDLGLRFDSW